MNWQATVFYRHTLYLCLDATKSLIHCSSIEPAMSSFLVFFLACLAVGAHAADLSSDGLLAEVWRATSGEYLAMLNIGSPPQPQLLLLDISQQYIWVQCTESPGAFVPRLSTTFKHTTRNGTSVFVDIPGTTRAQKVADSFTFNITDGRNPGLSDVEVKRVQFFCSSSSPSSQTANGVVGLGRGKLALPSAIASRRNLPRRFAYCLSGVTQILTPLFLSSTNYTFMPGYQLSDLQYTPFMKPSKKKPGYRLGLLSITLGGTTLKINPKVFKGGLEVSTTQPYTKLVTPAYQALRDAFREAENGIMRVPAVAPFDTCFNASGLGSTRVGPPVNQINFVFKGNTTSWPFFGSSSMVLVSEDVLCLGFLDAGPLLAHSILGTYQQQDSLVEIDLDKNRIGIYPTLAFIRTTCGNFNFTRSDI